MNCIISPWIFAILQIGLICGYVYFKYFVPKPKTDEDRIFVGSVRKRYKSVKESLNASEEKRVPISEMYVYPIRGIRAGCEVDSFELGAFGIKYDRELVIVSKKELTLVR